jgi:hypothetical protein
MKRALKAAALAALLMTTVVAAPERSSRTNESITFDHKTTTKKKYELPVPEEGTRVHLHVKASVREGKLNLVVRDPANVMRYVVFLGPSKSKPDNFDVDSGEMKSPAGVWTVEVETKEAVGSYEFTFTQNDG